MPLSGADLDSIDERMSATMRRHIHVTQPAPSKRMNGAALKWLLGLLSVAVVAGVTAIIAHETRIAVIENVMPRIEKKIDQVLEKLP